MALPVERVRPADPEGPSSPEPPRHQHPGWRGELAALAAVAATAAVLFWLVHDALIDDSYITLGYARGLALRGEWGMIPGEVANSATSPGNVLLLAAGTLVLGSAVWSLGAVFIAAAAVLALALRRAAADSGMPAWTGLAGTALVVLNPLLLSTVGLEMPVAAAVLGVLLAATVGDRPWMFGAAAGALALLRLDLGVFVVIALLGRPALWRVWWKWLTAAVALTAPWFTFSWLHFGSALPDTLVIKQLQRAWGPHSFDNGLVRLVDGAPVAMALAVLPAACGTIAVLVLGLGRLFGRMRGAWPWALFGLGGSAHYAIYTQLDVPPYHWYYVPWILGTSLALVGLLGTASARIRLAVPVLAVCAALLVPQVVFSVHHGLPWRTAPIQTNWGTAADYARIGTAVGRIVGDATVTSPGEIGTLAYFCDCRIVDGFSDRGYLAGDLRQRLDETSPFGRALLELNYRHFTPTEPRPVDYVLRHAEGPAPEPFWNISTPGKPVSHLVLEPVG